MAIDVFTVLIERILFCFVLGVFAGTIIKIIKKVNGEGFKIFGKGKS